MSRHERIPFGSSVPDPPVAGEEREARAAATGEAALQPQAQWGRKGVHWLRVAAGEEIAREREIALEASGLVPTSGAFAALLDNVVALADGQIVSRIVVAPVTGCESSRRVTAGIVAEARHRSLRACSARMEASNGRWVLSLEGTLRSGRGDGLCQAELPPDLRPLLLDLRSEHGREDLETWLDLASEDLDLIVVEGAALSASLDAALLARSCDGLLLVAEEKRTAKEHLRRAAGMARAADCHIFGVVVDQARERLPRWLRAMSPR